MTKSFRKYMLRFSSLSKLIFLGSLVLSGETVIYARTLEGDKLERLIITPSAERMISGKTLFDLDYLPVGAILISVKAALSHRVTIGLSIGASHFIDNKGGVWNKIPGAYFKYAICDEKYSFLQMFLGIDTQGWGERISNPNSGQERYFIKAPGIFFVVGRQFNLKCIKDLGLSGGLNYNFFENKDDKDLNFYAGTEKKILKHLTLVAEYDFALNDNDAKAFGKDKGYLNGSLRLQIRKEFYLEFIVLDALISNKNSSIETKAIRITFQPEYWF